MVAILTGDIINSRQLPAKNWLAALKKSLETIADEKAWEIFRGDSFQIQSSVQDALQNAIYLKACIRSVKGVDVRIGVGIGETQFSATKITESNGEAFIFSGETLDELKKDRLTLAIQSPWQQFDYEINISIRLALIAMNNWSPISAEMVKRFIENKGISQNELAELSKKSQSSVSEALKRAHLNEILELENLYRKKVNSLVNA